MTNPPLDDATLDKMQEDAADYKNYYAELLLALIDGLRDARGELRSSREEIEKIKSMIDSIPYSFVLKDPDPPESKYAAYKAGLDFAFNHAQEHLRSAWKPEGKKE